MNARKFHPDQPCHTHSSSSGTNLTETASPVSSNKANTRKSFICRICSSPLMTRQGLQRHVDSLHFNKFKFVCHYTGCTKKYLFPSSLRYHIRRIHLGISVNELLSNTNVRKRNERIVENIVSNITTKACNGRPWLYSPYCTIPVWIHFPHSESSPYPLKLNRSNPISDFYLQQSPFENARIELELSFSFDHCNTQHRKGGDNIFLVPIIQVSSGAMSKAQSVSPQIEQNHSCASVLLDVQEVLYIEVWMQGTKIYELVKQSNPLAYCEKDTRCSQI